MLEHQIIDRVGWALVHSVWQIAVIACLVAVCNRILFGKTANVRYLVACIALLAMTAAPVVTFFAVSPMDGGSEAMADARSAEDLRSRSRETSEMSKTPPEFSRTQLQQANGLDARPRLTPDATDHPAVANERADGNNVGVTSDLNVIAVWQDRISSLLRPAMPAIVGVWLVGMILLSIRPLAGVWTVRRVRRVGRSDVKGNISAVVHRLCDRMGIRKAVEVAESAMLEVPAVVGSLRPLLLLPATVCTDLTPLQLEAVIAHELAHIRRHDFLVNIFQTLVETVLFYHPAVWWVSHVIRQEREHCCDDIAISVCDDRAAYAKALVALDAVRGSAPQAALAATGGSLLKRIRRILRKEPVASRGVLPLGIVVLVIAAVTCAAFWSPTSSRAEATELDPLDSSAWKGKATIKLADRTYLLGENVHLQFGITNTQDEPVEIHSGGDYRGGPRPLRFKVVAYDSNGKRVKDPYQLSARRSHGGLSPNPTKTPPGETKWLHVPLGRYCDFQEPGEYTLRVYHDLGWDGDYWAKLPVNELPTESHTAPVGEAKIKFAMPTKLQAEQLVDRMAAFQREHPHDTNYGPNSVDFVTLRQPVYMPLLKRLTCDRNRTVARQARRALREFFFQDRIDTVAFDRDEAEALIKQFKPAWSSAKQGIRFGLSHATEQRTFRIGERVPVTLFVHNVSDKAATVNLYADFFQQVPTVLDNQNKVIELERFSASKRPIHEVTFLQTLKAGEMFAVWHPGVRLRETAERNYVPDHEPWKAFPYWKTPRVGTYGLSQTHAFDVSDPSHANTTDRSVAARSAYTTGAIRFEIVGDNEERKTDRGGEPATDADNADARVDVEHPKGRFFGGADALRAIENLKPAWSEEKLGVQLGVSHFSKKRRFQSGDVVRPAIFIRNTSNEAVAVELDLGYMWNIPTVRDYARNRVQFHQITATGLDTPFREVLKPGEAYALRHPTFCIGPPEKVPGYSLYWQQPIEGTYSLTQTEQIKVTPIDDAKNTRRASFTTGKIEFEVRSDINTLLKAINEGDLNLVKELVDKVDRKADAMVNHPLFVLLSPNVEVVDFLNSRWKLKLADLQLAVIRGDSAKVKRTLDEMEADEKAAKLSGFPPSLLYLAAIHDRHDVIRELVRQGANPNAVPDRYLGSPLSVAAERGRVGSVSRLLYLKADVNLQADGYTPLMRACWGKQPAAARMLLEHGANPNIARHDGQTALHLAAKRGSAYGLKLLLEYGADPKALAYERDTALSYASFYKHEQSVAVLRDAADPAKVTVPDDKLKEYLAKSDLCIAGTITSPAMGMTGEMYVVNYSCEFEISEVIFGKCEEKKPRVNIVHFEMAEEDRLPFIRKGGKCILFLKRMPAGHFPVWQSIDMRYGTERYSESLTQAIKRVAAQKADGAAPPEEQDSAASKLLKQLSSPSQQTRDTAARQLRDIYVPPTRERWDQLLSKIKPGDAKKEILRQFGTDESKVQEGRGTGPYHMETYRLDDRWLLSGWFYNVGNTVGHEGNTLKEAKLADRMREVLVAPADDFTGVWTNYFVNGQRCRAANYKDGRFDGLFTAFHSDGAKAFIQHYVAGVIEGKGIGYFPTGEVSYRAFYAAGKPTGVWTWYEKDGSIRTQHDHGGKPRAKDIAKLAAADVPSHNNHKWNWRFENPNPYSVITVMVRQYTRNASGEFDPKTLAAKTFAASERSTDEIRVELDDDKGKPRFTIRTRHGHHSAVPRQLKLTGYERLPSQTSAPVAVGSNQVLLARYKPQVKPDNDTKLDDLAAFVSLEFHVETAPPRKAATIRRYGGEMPEFDRGSGTWYSTHIVLADGGDEHDGEFRVIESWKGNLQAGQQLSIPELALFKDQATRKISERYVARADGDDLEVVTGRKMVLCLIKSDWEDGGEWLSAMMRIGGHRHDIDYSVVWIEGTDAYAIKQPKNPGPNMIVPLEGGLAKLKADVKHFIDLKSRVQAAIQIEDRAKRAAALLEFTKSDSWHARHLADEQLDAIRDADAAHDRESAEPKPVRKKPVSPDSALSFESNFADTTDANLFGYPDEGGWIYTAESVERKTRLMQSRRADVTIAEGQGIRGDCLRFGQKSSDVLFYLMNPSLRRPTKNWSGAVTFWIKPDFQKIGARASYPLQFFDGDWNRGGFFVRLPGTKTNAIEVGVVSADTTAAQRLLTPEEVSPKHHTVISINDAPIASDRWTFLTITFENANPSGEGSSLTKLYIDGELRWQTRRLLKINWMDPDTAGPKPDAAAFLGIDYIGDMDEFRVYDRAISKEQILAIRDEATGDDFE